MLTADLVKGRVTKGSLKLQKTDRESAEEFAKHLISRAEMSVGRSRALVLERLEYKTSAKTLLLYRGLKKLVLDRASFDVPEGIDPVELRVALFSKMSEAFRQDSETTRESILEALAKERNTSAAELDAWLFADTKDAQRMVRFDSLEVSDLLQEYERAKIQAVLLRAQSVCLYLENKDKNALRDVLRRIKFHGLLFDCEKQDEGLRLTLDGPLSVFSQTTKYGLKLALALRAAMHLDVCEVSAQLMWGKSTKKPAHFRCSAGGLAGQNTLESRASDRALAFLDKFNAHLEKNKKKVSYRAELSTTVIDVGEQNLCFPDLLFTNAEGQKAHLEFLGFWSREAVFRRVDWCARCDERLLFAYSDKLRVSEKVARGIKNAQLISYKSALSVREVIKSLDAVFAAPK